MKKISKQDLIFFLNTNHPPKTVSEKNINQVLYFSLIWNSFEGSFFSEVELDNQTLSMLATNYASFIGERYINEIFDKFRKRYVSDNKINNKRFDGLRFLYKKRSSNEKAEAFTRKHLLIANPTREAKLKTVLLIIYRFRNNMFHGRKAALTLNLYEEVFTYINQFLIRLVTALIEDKKNVMRTLKNNK